MFPCLMRAGVKPEQNLSPVVFGPGSIHSEHVRNIEVFVSVYLVQ